MLLFAFPVHGRLPDPSGCRWNVVGALLECRHTIRPYSSKEGRKNRRLKGLEREKSTAVCCRCGLRALWITVELQLEICSKSRWYWLSARPDRSLSLSEPMYRGLQNGKCTLINHLLWETPSVSRKETLQGYKCVWVIMPSGCRTPYFLAFRGRLFPRYHSSQPGLLRVIESCSFGSCQQ